MSPWQLWFAATAFPPLLLQWLACCVVHATVRDRTRAEATCLWLGRHCFRLLLALNPQIRVELAPGAAEQLQRLVRETRAGPGMVLSNHTSFLDGMVFAALLPAEAAMRTRTLLKAALLKLPVFGSVCRMVGHFPVHFQSEARGKFSLRREAMQAVLADVERFVEQERGWLALYPEGQVNPEPRKLQPFRRGAFEIAARRRLPLWGLVTAGCEQSWPRRSKVGGRPATVRVNVFKIPVPAEFATAEQLMEAAREAMQGSVDSLDSLGGVGGG